MYLKNPIILLASAILFGGCMDDDGLVPAQVIKTHENGFSSCIEHILLNQDYCTELRAYSTQINNSNDARFDIDAYTPKVNSTNSLEGRWLIISEENTLSSKFRQSCELNEQSGNSNNFDLTCSEAPYTGMVFNLNTNVLDISESIRTRPGTGDEAGLDRVTTETVYGLVSNLNEIEVNKKTVSVWSDGYTEELTRHFYTLIRVGDTASPLGQINVEKYDFEGNLQLMEQYDVGALLEKDDSITLSDMAGATLAVFSNNMTVKNADTLEVDAFDYVYPLYGNTYDVDLFPGLDPYLFDGIGTQVIPTPEILFKGSFELRLRQFDYVENDAVSLNIDWLINRRQATRFERGDTIGNVSLSF